MEHIIIYGSTGYIGSEFRKQSEQRGWQVDLVSHTNTDASIDVTPDSVVINCCAYVCKPSVDLNDNEKEETLMGNLVFPSKLAVACQKADISMLHVSTGCLYHTYPPTRHLDHHKFTENDAPMLTFDKGAGFYVGSKALAERAVGLYKKTWICRTRLPFDNIDHPRNFLSKLMGYPKILDTYNSLSHRGDFVKACLDMIEQRVPYGIYNCTNPGAVWTHNIAKLMSSRPGVFKTEWEYWMWDEFVKTRKTPMSNAELDCSKLLSTGVRIRTVQEALEDSIRNWRTA